MRKKYYYIIKLNLTTLFKLVKESRNSGLGEVTVVEITSPASAMLKIVKALRLLKVPLNKVEPRSSAAGPVLYLSKVRNDKGEVVALDFYHEILSIRRQIFEQLYKTYAADGFFKNKKFMGMMLSCYGLRVAQDITAAVSLAFYAKWRKIEEQSERENILIQAGNQWRSHLETLLADKFHRVIAAGRMGQALSQRLIILKNFAHALVHLTYLSLFRLLRPRIWKKARSLQTQYRDSRGKILMSYRMGISKDKRNDITYYHSSDLAFDRLFILVKSKSYIPSSEEMEWISSNGANILSTFKIPGPGPDIPVWKRTPISKQLQVQFYKLYLKTLFQSIKKPKKDSLWMLDKFWEIEKTAIFWKDFYLTNRVRILVNSTPSDLNFIPNMAIAELGGLAVEFERSIRFDYCTYIHNSPNHVYFATGPYSLTQTPEPSFSYFSVQTGGINVIENPKPIEAVAAIRKKSEIILTVFDEHPNDIFFGESVVEMYRIILELTKRDTRFGLLIKTKKPQIIENMEDVYPEILHLSKEGRCLLADWRVSPSTAIKNGDLVVGVISTAAFESVLLGAKTAIYNPMKAGSKIFYKNGGLNRRVFEEKQPMLDALLRFADGTNNGIGDCTDIAVEIDPFGDEKGSLRMGQYLETCLQGFDNGQDWKAVLDNANRQYAHRWGKQHVVGDNAYEIKN